MAIHVDEVFYGNSTLLNFLLYDIDRVEVLKGPQGTLYGRNTSGGSINFFSRQPGDEVNGDLDIGYGNYGTFSAQGSLGGPLSDTVSARVSAQRGEPQRRSVSRTPSWVKSAPTTSSPCAVSC